MFLSGEDELKRRAWRSIRLVTINEAGKKADHYQEVLWLLNPEIENWWGEQIGQACDSNEGKNKR
jgi:hypothetical protein